MKCPRLVIMAVLRRRSSLLGSVVWLVYEEPRAVLSMQHCGCFPIACLLASSSLLAACMKAPAAILLPLIPVCLCRHTSLRFLDLARSDNSRLQFGVCSIITHCFEYFLTVHLGIDVAAVYCLTINDSGARQTCYVLSLEYCGKPVVYSNSCPAISRFGCIREPELA